MAKIRKRTRTLPSGTEATDWQVDYRSPEGKRIRPSFKRKVDAQRWLDAQTTSRSLGTWVDPKDARGTVGAEAAAWLASGVDWKVSTRARNESIVKNHIQPRWGTVQLGQVTTEAIQKWVNGMTLSAGTVRKNHGVLSSILDHAIKMRRLGVNPCRGVTLPRQVRKKRRYLTDVEVEALATEAGPYALVVYVLAYCGLRWGEMAALTVGNVDLDRRRLIIERSVTEVGTMVWSDPKTHQRRSVAYLPFLDDMMADQVKGREREDLLFPAGDDAVMREGNARRNWFDGAVEDAGIGKLTPHELRHTAASLAIRSGADPKVVQNMLGHASAAMTLDTYADLFDDGQDIATAKMNAAREEALRVASEELAKAGGHHMVTTEVVSLNEEPSET
ncbi:Integrase [Acidipropionibacterium jensenii]|uniref:Integrase n=1 Tax=Acidipropionibacterium jensenii TaxID=1749 RepID=A0A3S4V7S9_9ACTN|nr:site-specific integrase [Acidipropionibacterium jensenii]VEI03731.1 Integrase [Acidipropionibacterium jensenii]